MKDIHIEFAGGLWDGEHLYGNSCNVNEARLAKKCFWATKAGTVGEHYSVLSAKAMHQLRMQAHTDDRLDTHQDYVVTVRVETEREILVRLERADEDLRA